MTILIEDPQLEERLLAERRESGADRFDEVWDGVYVMSPIADNEHQRIATSLGTVYKLALGVDNEVEVYVGINVSDRLDDWTKNYRCPDVAVYLAGNPAQDRDTYWYGGPDHGVEVLSPGDRSRAKFEFYAKVGVRELLLIDRDPWQIELYRLQRGKLRLVDTSTVKKPTVLVSKVVPLSLRMIAGKKRPRIEALHADGKQRWVI